MVNSKEHGTGILEQATVTRRSDDIKMDKSETKVETALIDGWKRTYDIVGHEPLFDMMCVRCKTSFNKETKMQLRHTGIRLSKNAMAEIYHKEHPPEKPWVPISEEFDPEINMNALAYKCPHCAWFIRFQVPDTVEYLQEIFKKRDYNQKFVPIWETDELSEEELKSVERQLKSLGYWAGR